MPDYVLLLRSLPESIHNDGYNRQLEDSGFIPHSISPLDTNILNIDSLRDRVAAGDFDGVILTSSRSADAWGAALAGLDAGQCSTPLSAICYYVVGTKTSNKLTEAMPPAFYSKAGQIKGASEAGSAEKLAHFIIKDLRGKPSRLLYLTGDKNRDTLISILATATQSIQVNVIEVYETRESSQLGSSILEFAADLRKKGKEVKNIFVVFFAPSSSGYALPYLLEAFKFDVVDDSPASPDGDDRICAIPVAIGLTTAAYLHDDAKLILDIVAEKPTPQALAQSITDYINR